MTKIIAFAGKKGSGKDTAVSLLTGSEEYHNVKFAGPIKAMLRALLEYMGFDESAINMYLEGILKEEPLETWGGKSTREIMQSLGDYLREIDPDFLLNCFREASLGHEKVSCDDVRKQNECDLINELGGKVARICGRYGSDEDNHSTEASIEHLDVDFEIDNTGNMQYLSIQVKEFEGI